MMPTDRKAIILCDVNGDFKRETIDLEHVDFEALQELVKDKKNFRFFVDSLDSSEEEPAEYDEDGLLEDGEAFAKQIINNSKAIPHTCVSQMARLRALQRQKVGRDEANAEEKNFYVNILKAYFINQKIKEAKLEEKDSEVEPKSKVVALEAILD